MRSVRADLMLVLDSKLPGGRKEVQCGRKGKEGISSSKLKHAAMGRGVYHESRRTSALSWEDKHRVGATEVCRKLSALW